MTLAYSPDFIAKNGAQVGSSSLFVGIPAILLDWKDCSLCPVRALHHYVQHAAEFRLLFIPTARSTSGEIRVDQISRWVKQIMSAPYTAAEDEVRAIATSWHVYSRQPPLRTCFRLDTGPTAEYF